MEDNKEIEVKNETEQTEQVKLEEKPVEVEEQKMAETEEIKDEDITPVEETVTLAECEKRVSGMQASLQKQINAQKTEFQNEIKVRDEKLAEYKNEVISLNAKLEETAKELQKTASALAEKENALATLNASVNTPAEQTNWKALKGKAFFDWYAKTH